LGNTGYQPGISTVAQVVVNGFSTSTAISFSANPGKVGQPETLTATVTLGSGNPTGTGTPTGSVAFYGSGTLLVTVPLNSSGVAMYTTSLLPAGTIYVQAIYEPTGGFLGSSSQNLPLQIAALPLATVAVSPNPGTITSLQPVNVTITVSGSVGNPTPTGSVTLSSGNYSSTPTNLNGGSVMINAPAGSLPVGNDTLTAQYWGDSVYSAATGTGSVVVMAPFGISGTPVTVAAGASSGNQSTVTVNPTGGFTGSVALTAAITSNPAGASNLPALSFGSTGNVSITNSAAGTSTLTVTTIAPIGCSQAALAGRAIHGWPTSGFVFASILLIVPRRIYSRRGLLMLLLLIGVSVGATSCGGGSGTTSCTPVSPGTTPGNYAITVTGTSAYVTASGSVSLTVR